MNLSGFILVLISVSLSAAAQTSFKYGVSRVVLPEVAGVWMKALSFVASPFVVLGLGLYGVGTVLWLFALRSMDLSLVYPFVAMSFVMVSASGILFLGEPVSVARLGGIALIILGLLVMTQG